MRIIESNSEIEKKINKLLAGQITSALNKKKSIMRSSIIAILETALLSSPELNSLSSGSLKYDFGLEIDPSFEIINSIISTTRLSVRPIVYNGKSFKGGVSLYVQPSSYNNLLSLNVAYQSIKGGELPWLKWLLTAGDSILIVDYGVEYGLGLGRSGGAKMKEGIGPFRVNPSFSGTADNNFITRALSRYQKEIIDTIQGALK